MKRATRSSCFIKLKGSHSRGIDEFVMFKKTHFVDCFLTGRTEKTVTCSAITNSRRRRTTESASWTLCRGCGSAFAFASSRNGRNGRKKVLSMDARVGSLFRFWRGGDERRSTTTAKRFGFNGKISVCGEGPGKEHGGS